MNGNKNPEKIYHEKIISDKVKYEAAIQNNMRYYIINASQPETLFQTAKNVLSFIDFSHVSELECEKFANYKNIRNECELWNQGYSIEEIHLKLNESSQSIKKKLRLGFKYNMCNYNKEINKRFHKNINPNRAS